VFLVFEPDFGHAIVTLIAGRRQVDRVSLEPGEPFDQHRVFLQPPSMKRFEVNAVGSLENPDQFVHARPSIVLAAHRWFDAIHVAARILRPQVPCRYLISADTTQCPRRRRRAWPPYGKPCRNRLLPGLRRTDRQLRSTLRPPGGWACLRRSRTRP